MTRANTARSNTAYKVTTGLFCLFVLPGAVMDLVQPEMVLEIAERLSIPLYILTLLGVWKLLGVAALLAPGFDRVKEWAYAGFFFDLTGAAYWHAAAGDTAGIAPPLVILAVMGGSYWLRRQAQDGSVASTGGSEASSA